MKTLKFTLLLATCLLAFSCSKETNPLVEANLELTSVDYNPILSQVPNPKLDHTKKGLYHGIIASGTNTSRGKIWINLGNDGTYNAYVKMIDGLNIFYDLDKNASDGASHVYVFVNEESSFTVDVSDTENPLFSELAIGDQPFFATVVKGANSRMPYSFTGIFRETVAGSTFLGTWNLISSGITAPEGFGYETISSAVITFNGTMYTDTAFETFNYPCIGNPAFNAQMGSFVGNTNAIIAHTQSSFFNGATSWDLGTANGDYYNDACSIVSYGTFSWTSAVTGTTKNGLILID